MTFPRVSRRGRHFANVGDVIIYPDLVVARTGGVTFQPTEDSRSAISPFYSKLYFTVNSLEHRYCVTCREALHFVNKILTEQNFSFKLTSFIQFPSQVKYMYV